MALANRFKVAVLGSAGGIGQPLSLLLKQRPNISHLNLYDVAPVNPGVGADLSHIPTPAKVSAFTGDNLAASLKGMDVVLIPAGVPRKPGMTRDDLFNTNASIVQNLARACADNCPEAKILIIANPVNSTVPIVAEVFKKAGVYDPKKLFGVTTLDVLRANTFVSELKGLDVLHTNTPVVGGHAGKTIIPLFSQIDVKFDNEEELAKLTHRVQFGGDEVVQAKGGAGSATLSMAAAADVFTENLLRAMSGEKVVACSYVESSVTNAPFFSSKIELGPDGVKNVNMLGDITSFEQKLLDDAVPELIGSIEKGIKFAREN